MKKVIKYTIVCSDTISKLVKSVNEKIEDEGFEPIGSHIQTNTMPFMYQQAMVIYEN